MYTIVIMVINTAKIIIVCRYEAMNVALSLSTLVRRTRKYSRVHQRKYSRICSSKKYPRKHLRVYLEKDSKKHPRK
jgi:transposase